MKKLVTTNLNTTFSFYHTCNKLRPFEGKENIVRKVRTLLIEV